VDRSFEIEKMGVSAGAFDAWAQNPIHWLRSAESLRRAALLVEQAWLEDGEETAAALAGDPEALQHRLERMPPNLEGPWLLYVAFCLENLLKGLLVAQQPTIVANGKLGKLKSHHLVAFARDAAFDLSADESDLLAFLSPYAAGLARYPVGPDAEKTPCNMRIGTGAVPYLFPELFERLGRALVVEAMRGKTYRLGDRRLTVEETIRHCLWGQRPDDCDGSVSWGGPRGAWPRRET
jgi:hypothetical protein